MFKRIAVAYNESPEARRALASAIHLARTLGAELRTVTIVQGLPANMDSDAALDEVVTSDRLEAYEKLQCEAREAALRDGVQLVPHLLVGDEVDTFVSLLNTRPIYSSSGFNTIHHAFQVCGARSTNSRRRLLA